MNTEKVMKKISFGKWESESDHVFHVGNIIRVTQSIGCDIYNRNGNKIAHAVIYIHENDVCFFIHMDEDIEIEIDMNAKDINTIYDLKNTFQNEIEKYLNEKGI